MIFIWNKYTKTLIESRFQISEITKTKSIKYADLNIAHKIKNEAWITNPIVRSPDQIMLDTVGHDIYAASPTLE